MLQEVFREIWCKAERYDAKLAKLDFWMIMLTRSRAIDHLRRNGGPTSLGAPEPPTTGCVREGEAVRSELADRTLQAMRRLPEAQRDAITLAFFRGQTGRQIAALRGIPLGTAKTRIRSGIRKLREYLDGQEIGNP